MASICEQLIVATGLQQQPGESALSFSTRLLEAARKIDRATLSPEVLSWMGLGTTVQKLNRRP